MLNIIVELSKYVMILMITMYTFTCFSIFGFQDPDKKKGMLRNQNVLMFMIHIIAFLVMYLETNDIRLLAFYLMQVVLFGATILLYTLIYPKVSRLVINNMCMLLCIGMIMLTRLDYASAVKQFVIAAGAIAISLVVPVVIRKFKRFSEWRNFYAIVGIISLAAVIVVGRVSGGAMLGFTVAGINIQPSELVKIVFVFFVASSFKLSLEFRNIVVTTALAAFHVLILVVSKDLGAALIMLTGEYMYHEFNAGDPARLGAQVISGIGFLGAGSIILEGKTKVRGLTTAAGLWTAACIGLAIGVGFYAGGIVITIIVHIVITKCKTLSDHFTHNNMWMIYYMEIDSICHLESIRSAIAAYGLEIGDITLNNPHNSGNYNIIVLIKNAECKDCSLIEEYLKNIEGIDSLKCIYV